MIHPTVEQVINFDLRTTTPSWIGPITEKHFEGYLNDHLLPSDRPNSVLYECGYVWNKAEVYANSVYLFAHAIHESGWGKSAISRKKNNLFGFGAYDASPMKSAKTFDSPADSVMEVAKYVRANYLEPDGKYHSKKYGATLKGMNQCYATDPLWSRKIAKTMIDFIEFVQANP